MSDTPATISADDIAPAALPTPTAPAVTAGAPTQTTPEGANTAGVSADSAPALDASQPAAGTLDAKGTPFDPSRHIPRTHPRTGAWMPRGGRKAGATPPASANPGTAQTAPDAPPPASYIPAEEPPPPQSSDAKPSTPPAPEVDHSDDAGEVVCSSVEVIAGIIFDAPEDCTPSAVEHKNMVRAVAAYIRAKGWQATAGVGLLLMFGAYLLRVLRKPKPNAAVRRWVGLDRAEKALDVTPEAERPSAPHSPAPQHRAEIIDVPAHVPPLAKV
jgi:hypothetical protein